MAGHWLCRPVLALPIFVVLGLYRAIFRYAGMAALAAVAKAIAPMGCPLRCRPGGNGPAGRATQSGHTAAALAAAGGGCVPRAWRRYWLSGAYMSALRRNALPKVLIYGAGSAGHQLASALGSSREMRAVGFLDDDAALHGRELNGLRIYDPAQLQKWVQRLEVSHVLLAVPSAGRQRRNQIIEAIRHAHVSVRTLPGLMDLAQGNVQVSDLRELDIDDLLGRSAVPPERSLFNRNIANKVVLVTGAGGSIGSELCRQIIEAEPTKLLLVELSEFALYAVHHDLMQLLSAKHASKVELLPLLASARDEDRMREIMRTWQPHTVYHAAAYKHVPLVEHNPAEGIKNNVLGTLTTARVAAEQGVSHFVLISTDKAVRPTNIMGTSKRLAEMVLQALAAASNEQGWTTRFAMVRFGNVLGSSGSVVPLFRQQIKDGGPVTLTHADITRYFMTIPEAAQLVIQAGAMAQGGDVFVLDMGEPVRIMDLARRMIELSGLSVLDDSNPEGDIAIEVTALRPGEKLYEELLIGNNPMPTDHPRIMKAQEDFLPWAELATRLQGLGEALTANDVPKIRTLLQELVPGYKPDAEIVDWVHLERRAAPRPAAAVVQTDSLQQLAPPFESETT